MHITSTNSYQGSASMTNFRALKLGKLNPHVSQETRNLADKAVDLYEKVAGKKLRVNGITLMADSFDEGALVSKGLPLELSKKIKGGKVELAICSECPREADITMTIKQNGKEIVYYYESNKQTYSCLRDITEKIETFNVKGKTTYTDNWGEVFRSYETPDKNDSNIFNKYLQEFLNSAEDLAKLFKK